MPGPSRLTIFDPRKGEEYFRFGISNVEERLVVIESVPRRLLFGLGITFDYSIELREVVPLVVTCMRKTAPLGFLACAPMSPQISFPVKVQTVNYHVGSQSACAFLEATENAVEAFLDQRAGAERWRTWTVGSCLGPFEPDPKDGYTFPGLLRARKTIGSLFWQEAYWVTMIIKLFDGIDDVLETLRRMGANETGE